MNLDDYLKAKARLVGASPGTIPPLLQFLLAETPEAFVNAVELMLEGALQHMEAGSELREKTNRGDILALMAVSKIRQIRAETNTSKTDIPLEQRPNIPLHRTAYIIDSLKHPMEVESLRDIYGRAFMVIGAYSPREKRVEDMSERIMTSVHSSDRNQHRAAAEHLIKIDEDEEGKDLGQNVSSAFPLADCFVDVSDRSGIQPASTGRRKVRMPTQQDARQGALELPGGGPRVARPSPSDEKDNGSN